MLAIEMMKKPRLPGILPGSKKKAAILAEAIYLDTETAHNYDPDTQMGCTWIYQWAFRWCRQFAIGRTPSSLLNALDWVAEANGCEAEKLHLLVYIHNASYDLSYLLPFLKQRYGIRNILATAPHKIIALEAGPFVFRCSYRLSNRSLYKWGKDLNIKHQKKKGMIDYDVRRYQNSKLVRRDWIYQLYDVVALEECVLAELAREHDTLASIPLTSTGYIRRYARKLSRAHRDRERFLKTRLTVETYKAARFSFAGGLTHGNRFLAAHTISCTRFIHFVSASGKKKIKRCYMFHRDFRSMYPSEMSGDFFPSTPFELFYSFEPGVPCSWREVDDLAAENCCLITAIVRGMELKKGETLPYAQYSKWVLGASSDWHADVLDNGRIIKCTGTAALTFTEIDWNILRQQYVFEEEPRIMEVWFSKRGPVPEYLRETVDHFYQGKSELKDVCKHLDAIGAPEAEQIDAAISLTKSKNGLNGCSGMAATDPVRLDYHLDENTWEWSHTLLTNDIIAEKLDKFYNSRNSFMRYQVGIYVTAAARADLMKMYRIIGPKNFVYGDTDSIFYISTPEIEERLEAENKRRYDAAIANHRYIEYDGKVVTYDAFELEKYKGRTEKIKRFRFLHAKAYAYKTNDNKLHVTVAGVAARDAKGYTREQELRSIDNLKEGTVFRRCGSTTSVYLTAEPEIVMVDGHRIETAGGCVLLPTVKTLHEEINRDLDLNWVVEPTRKEVKG